MLRKQINNTLDHFFKTIHRICTSRATLSLVKLCRQSTRYQVWFAILYTVYSSSLKSELKNPGLLRRTFAFFPKWASSKNSDFSVFAKVHPHKYPDFQRESLHVRVRIIIKLLYNNCTHMYIWHIFKGAQ